MRSGRVAPAKPTVCSALAQKLSSAVLLKISQGVMHSGRSGPDVPDADASPASCCSTRPNLVSSGVAVCAPAY